jgi:hypothetical protein
MRKLLGWMLLGVLVLTMGACASSGPSTASSGAPPASNVTGRWAGTYVFEPSSAGNGEVALNITQDGRQVKGTVEIQGPHRGRAGFFNGTMSGNDIQITGPDATGWLKVEGSQMSGMINGILPARLSLRKQ